MINIFYSLSKKFLLMVRFKLTVNNLNDPQ